jgi:hypothetical protein
MCPLIDVPLTASTAPPANDLFKDRSPIIVTSDSPGSVDGTTMFGTVAGDEATPVSSLNAAQVATVW